jgi:acetyl esterase/lipase
MTTRTGRPTRVALILSLTTLSIAIWTVVPPPTYPLLVVAVAAPEIGAWLVTVALFAAVLALPRLLDDGRAQLSFGAALVTIGLAVSPFVRLHAVERGFEDVMRTALGEDPLEHVPDDVRQRLRATPVAIRDLFFGLRLRRARVTHDIVYAASDGAKLALDVYQPVSRGTYPAIVQIYGGAWQRGAPRDNERFARCLAAQGYVVFAIDYRHAPQWQWPTQFEDIQAALRWISDHARDYDADVTRLALIGRSSGAQLALLAAYAQDVAPVRAVVSFYGPVDLARSYREPPQPDPLRVRDVAAAYLGGTPDEQAARYAEASPISYATHPLPPTLLVYGGRDHVVQARFAEALQAKLQASGSLCALLVIPWAEHAFDSISGGPSAQLALYHVERYLAWALYRQ